MELAKNGRKKTVTLLQFNVIAGKKRLTPQII